jgi:hypothetical protein
LREVGVVLGAVDDPVDLVDAAQAAVGGEVAEQVDLDPAEAAEPDRTGSSGCPADA